MSMHCKNPKCYEELNPFSREWFCPSCRYIGRLGMFLGGVLVGLVAGLLKLAKVI